MYSLRATPSIRYRMHLRDVKPDRVCTRTSRSATRLWNRRIPDRRIRVASKEDHIGGLRSRCCDLAILPFNQVLQRIQLPDCALQLRDSLGRQSLRPGKFLGVLGQPGRQGGGKGMRRVDDAANFRSGAGCRMKKSRSPPSSLAPPSRSNPGRVACQRLGPARLWEANQWMSRARCCVAHSRGKSPF